MARAVLLAGRYPALTAALVTGALGGTLALTGEGTAARLLLSGFALLIALIQGVGMVRNLLRGKAGVDILAVAAILATVIVGEYWASIVIVIMLTGGEALEDYAARRARRELSALLERAPVAAHRLDERGAVVDVPIGDVQVGDLLSVRPGEVVPVDSLLESAAATTDESSLTGESMPVEHVRGDALLSGSVNGASALVVRATASAAESQYQRIVQMVRAAAESKAPVVRLADRYAVPFTLAAFALAGTAWAISGDPVRFAEVLVVATPCPLLIAAPVAFLAGMSRGAKNGIIVKGGGTLEQLSRAQTVAFDKTGTLTHGTPEVVDVRPAPGWDDATLLALAAGAEQSSGHVLARAIVTAAAGRGLALEPIGDVREVTGYGVVATVGGREVAVGKPAFLRRRGLDVAEPPRAPGQMVVVVDVDGRYAGAVVLGDRVRANARATVDRLRNLGVVDTVMLTGDSAATAAHVAQQVGIARVAADCLPQDKVRVVSEIARRPVVMVGDGVNDAPVLAAADVGIALGARGATAASESADVVIMLDDVSKTAQAIAIGRRTMLIALQSIWLGIALSGVLMVIAVVGVLPAVVGAGLQEVVDLASILNALRALGGRQDAAWRAATAQASSAPRTTLLPEWVASPSKGSSDTSTTL
jgi:heavy metal translocating P-type ATPase